MRAIPLMRKNEEGVIAVEASISLMLFMFLVLLLYSFFIIFEAQYSMEHALLQAGKTMSLESYGTQKVVEGNRWDNSGDLGTLIAMLRLGNSTKDGDFASYTTWYEEDEDVAEMAKKRVIAFLGGKDADGYLKKLRIAGGEEGLDFGETAIEDGDLVIRVKFRCNTVFNFPAFNLDHVDFNMSTRSALWMETD